MEEKIFYEDKKNDFYISQRTLDYFSGLLGSSFFPAILFRIEEQKDFQNPISAEIFSDKVTFQFNYDTEKDLPILIGKSRNSNIVEKIELDKMKTVNQMRNFTFNNEFDGSFRVLFSDETNLIVGQIQSLMPTKNFLIQDYIYSGTGFVVDTETNNYIDTFGSIKIVADVIKSNLSIYLGVLCQNINFKNLKDSVAVDFYFDNGFTPLRFKNLQLENSLFTDKIYLCPPNENIKLVEDFNTRKEFFEYCKKNLFDKKSKKEKMFNDLVL